MQYADVIVDISHETVDKPFEYIIPDELASEIRCGSQVVIPFGRGSRKINGFVINIKKNPSIDKARLKAIDSIVRDSKAIESDMIELAWFIKTNYGSTMNQALKIVLPVKKSSAPVKEKYIIPCNDETKLQEALEKYSRDRRTVAKYRLLKEISEEKILPYSMVRDKLNISAPTLKALTKEGLIFVDVKENLRDVISVKDKHPYEIRLNDQQSYVAEDIWKRFNLHDRRPSLIYGVTGSGKTEIYIELIDNMIKAGKQAVVLIPEIALTYQTVIRFYRKFGDRISVVNSRLTQAQKHDQLEKARKGQVDIIIGPRSALFTPFKNLGIIIIDEEHEGTYKNETAPRYHSREVAVRLAQIKDAIVVMGSATPSVESYYKAEQGIYQLYSLERRATGAKLPDVEIVDLRDELAAGNRSIISYRLQELIRDRLNKQEQIILFINRRAYQSFVSCRSCGAALKCPHCDVSLKYHKNGKLICHYCGYEMPMVKVCPSCGSKYIGTFGAGTQKVEEEINNLFPEASTLRMDMDTTREKDAHEKILSAFANHEADILIGTQMIVKGHDFANVTLVGILAADLSLYSGGYMAAERTFQLLTQAAGRAGRGNKEGNVIIQTYSPDNYAVSLGAAQDYKAFYNFETSYRKIMGYPPFMNILGILISCESEKILDDICTRLSAVIDAVIANRRDIIKIGPAQAPIAKIQDRYRKIIYIKAPKYAQLTLVKDYVEEYMNNNPDNRIQITFDFSLNNEQEI